MAIFYKFGFRQLSKTALFDWILLVLVVVVVVIVDVVLTLTRVIKSVFFFPSSFLHTSTFQLLDKPWSQVSSLLPPCSCLQFLSRIGFSNPTARRFSSSVANSRSRVFRMSNYAQEKVPSNLYVLIVSRVDFILFFKGVFGTVRTGAYRRYIPPVLPVPDTTVSSVRRKYRYRKLR